MQPDADLSREQLALEFQGCHTFPKLSLELAPEGLFVNFGPVPQFDVLQLLAGAFQRPGRVQSLSTTVKA